MTTGKGRVLCESEAPQRGRGEELGSYHSYNVQCVDALRAGSGKNAKLQDMAKRYLLGKQLDGSDPWGAVTFSEQVRLPALL